MARTRGSKPAAENIDESPAPEPGAKSLSAADSNAPKLFILPKGASAGARIITLHDPATAQPNRYYFCPEKGLYEFIKVAANKSLPRSWLLASHTTSTESDKAPAIVDEGAENAGSTSKECPGEISNGYTSKRAEIFIATPLDPIFILLPIIAPSTTEAKSSRKQMFLTFDDHVDTAPNISKNLKALFREQQSRAKFEDRLSAACDVVEAGEDSMYRISLEKLGKELISKSTRMIANGLPASMEERFIRRILQAPVVSVKREVSAEAMETIATTETEGASQAPESQASTVSVEDSLPSSESQLSIATSVTTVASATESMVGTSHIPPATPAAVLQLLRIRTAIDFILRSYIPSNLHSSILSTMADLKLIDFTPLDSHLKHLDALRAEAQTLRAISDNISRKRPADDDEAAEVRAEKKRKKEEEEKKKKTESRGLKALRKVDTAGMKKLSSFFTKGPKKETKE